MRIDFLIKRVDFRIFLPDISQNVSLKTPAQIQVLKPNQVALIFYALDDGFHIRNAREDRRNEAGRPDSGIMKRFHRGEASLDWSGTIHIRAETFVKRIDTETDANVPEAPDKINVAENEVRLCLDADPDFIRDPAVSELRKERPRALEAFFFGQVWIRDRSEEKFLSSELRRVFQLVPIFDVQERPPGFGMIREAFHEAGVAVPAAMRTAHIWVHGVIRDGKVRFRQDTFNIDKFYNWIGIAHGIRSASASK